MAVVNRNTLVLNGVSVVRDVVTGTVGSGFGTACGKSAAMPFSMRPPSHSYPQAGQETSPRQHPAARRDADRAAGRAGRPGCSGVLAQRGCLWPLATGGAYPTAAWRFGRFTAKHPASVGNALPGHLLASRGEAPRIGTTLRLPGMLGVKRHAEAGPVGFKPAGGALLTSARGFGF
jgi:hypothetical protein